MSVVGPPQPRAASALNLNGPDRNESSSKNMSIMVGKWTGGFFPRVLRARRSKVQE